MIGLDLFIRKKICIAVRLSLPCFYGFSFFFFNFPNTTTKAAVIAKSSVYYSTYMYTLHCLLCTLYMHFHYTQKLLYSFKTNFKKSLLILSQTKWSQKNSTLNNFFMKLLDILTLSSFIMSIRNLCLSAWSRKSTFLSVH